jgi:rhamnulokinase
MAADYLAFDLGAESGRAMLGRLRDGRLELSELHRFPNRPLSEHGSLRWDIRGLWSEMRSALDRAPAGLASIGVDTWGVDFGMLDAQGKLLENPFHYRDRRTEGVMDSVFARVSRDRIYATTGIQFLPFNTLYQLCATAPETLARAESLLTIPDLLNYWLTGNRAAEYTIATTTQLIDARTRTWAIDLIEELGLPPRLFLPMVDPGIEIGRVTRDVSRAMQGVPVIAPACHDTGSAVAAIEMSTGRAFLSSGTWSLLGAELPNPVITPRARDLNFTNEGGVCDTVRVLKNIAGLWLLQSCRRSWPESSYDDLLNTVIREPAFSSIIDPDDPVFLNPPDMTEAIAGYCRRTGQPAPDSPPTFACAIFESLALKYREVLESLEEITGRQFSEIRVIGGGSRNRVLNQFTADATGRTVIAGPVDATALGNIAMQMLGTGAVSNLAEARAIIARSFPTERFEPASIRAWDDAFARFGSLRDV